MSNSRRRAISIQGRLDCKLRDLFHKGLISPPEIEGGLLSKREMLIVECILEEIESMEDA
jgi:hypothetical protein